MRMIGSRVYRCFSYIHEWGVFFFFKQKTEYEMRISDGSSDVCSSDLLDYLGPGIDGVAAEARRRVRAGVDGGELHGAAETVERKRPRQRDHVATVDDAPAEAALALGMLVEVHARRVLVEARRHLMLRLLDGHGVAVVDPLARFVIGPAMRRAGRR